MLRFCRYCNTMRDFQVWTETTMSTQKQAHICTKCEHPISWVERRFPDGKIVSTWSDEEGVRLNKQKLISP